MNQVDFIGRFYDIHVTLAWLECVTALTSPLSKDDIAVSAGVNGMTMWKRPGFLVMDDHQAEVLSAPIMVMPAALNMTSDVFVMLGERSDFPFDGADEKTVPLKTIKFMKEGLIQEALLNQVDFHGTDLVGASVVASPIVRDSDGSYLGFSYRYRVRASVRFIRSVEFPRGLTSKTGEAAGPVPTTLSLTVPFLRSALQGQLGDESKFAWSGLIDDAALAIPGLVNRFQSLMTAAQLDPQLSGARVPNPSYMPWSGIGIAIHLGLAHNPMRVANMFANILGGEFHLLGQVIQVRSVTVGTPPLSLVDYAALVRVAPLKYYHNGQYTCAIVPYFRQLLHRFSTSSSVPAAINALCPDLADFSRKLDWILMCGIADGLTQLSMWPKGQSIPSATIPNPVSPSVLPGTICSPATLGVLCQELLGNHAWVGGVRGAEETLSGPFDLPQIEYIVRRTEEHRAEGSYVLWGVSKWRPAGIHGSTAQESVAYPPPGARGFATTTQVASGGVSSAWVQHGMVWVVIHTIAFQKTVEGSLGWSNNEYEGRFSTRDGAAEFVVTSEQLTSLLQGVVLL